MLLTNKRITVSLLLLTLFLLTSRPLTAQWGFLHLVEWSPAGDKIVAATTDTIWVYDTSGALMGSSTLRDRIVSVSWSPDGERLAVLVTNTAESEEKWILDIKNADDLTNLLTVEEIRNSAMEFARAMWSPIKDDHILLIVSSTPKILDANTGQTLLVPETQDYYAYNGSWNLDGTQIVIASIGDFEGLLIWDAETGALLGTSSGRFEVLLTVIPDPHHLLIAHTVGEHIGDIEIWNATLSQAVTVLPGDDSSLLDLEWSKGRLASSSVNGTIRIWDVANERVLFTFEEGSRVESISWSPDGSQLAYGGANGTLKIISLPTPIAPNPDTLRAKITECVPDQGLQTSLLAKVNAGQYGAIINQVEALPENKLTNSCAGQIINMAQYFVENPPGGSE